MTFRVRHVEDCDASVIHALGSNAPELNVGGIGGGFPSLDELERDLFDSDWLVAEDERGHVWGFCCARAGDLEKPGQRSACIVYLFVEPRHRHKGLAKMLWDEMAVSLGAAGVTHVYALANPASGVVEFFEKQGFTRGKPCVWMDCDLSGARP